MHHPTDRITHTTAFVTPAVEHWLEREILLYCFSQIARWPHGLHCLYTSRVLLYAPSQDSTYHALCYTSRGALAGMRNSSMGPP